MMSKKILLTYKRRRFASDSCANGSKANTLSSKDQSEASPEDIRVPTKLNEDNVFCFRCGTFDINEDLLVCDRCCGSYHFRCIDNPLEKKWLCPVCEKEHIIEETMGRYVQENTSNHATTVEGSDKEVAKCKDEDFSCVVPQESDDPAPSIQNLDKSTKYPSNVGNLNEPRRAAKGGLWAPLITFSRRVKKKTCSGELVSENKSKAVDGSLNQVALSPVHGTFKDKVGVGTKNGVKAPLVEICVDKTIPVSLNTNLYSHDLSQHGEPSDIRRSKAIFRPVDSMHKGSFEAALDLTIAQPAMTFSSSSERIEFPKGVACDSPPDPGNSSARRRTVFVLDEEADERGKSLGWLGMDNVLQEPRKARNSLLNQDFPRDYITEMGKSHRKLSLTPPGIMENGLLHHGDPRSVHIYDRRYSWLAVKNEPPLFPKHDLLAENVGTHHNLKETQVGLPENFLRYPREWSEEELDSLWIGVRRYGMCRWNTVLRDPKLRFSPSRSAAELAAQWELEHRKLLNGAAFTHPGLLGPGLSPPSPLLNDVFARLTSGPHFGGRFGSSLHSNSGFQKLPGEMVVSLGGDVYLRREKIPYGDYNLESEFRNTRPEKLPISRRSSEQTPRLPTSSGNTTLPHWLKEVKLAPSRSTAEMFSDLEKLAPSPNLDKLPPALPKSGRRRGILKRRSTAAAKLRTAGPSEIVIDSDASSEETISDNENSTP